MENYISKVGSMAVIAALALTMSYASDAKAQQVNPLQICEVDPITGLPTNGQISEDGFEVVLMDDEVSFDNMDESPYSTLDNYQAGGLEGDPNFDVNKLVIDKYNISGRFDVNKLNILMIPVAFQDINDMNGTLSYLHKNLIDAFKPVENVTFLTLSQNINIPLIKVSRYYDLQDPRNAKLLLDKIELDTGLRIDKLMFIANSTEYFGAAANNYVVMGGKNEYSLSTATHEVGHILGLSDSYRNIFSPGRMRRQTELFTNSHPPHPKIAKIAKRLGVELKQVVEYICGTEAVYSYTGLDNIMAKAIPSAQLEGKTNIFTDLQIKIMRFIADKKLSRKLEQ